MPIPDVHKTTAGPRPVKRRPDRLRVRMAALVLMLAGCSTDAGLSPFPPLGGPGVLTLHATEPAETGETGTKTCWAGDGRALPGPQAVFAEEPAAGDSGAGPEAALWFRVPCPADQVEDFTASLQRALQARGLYAGPADGQEGPATAAAIRAYQRPMGLDSGTLSLAAARKLGLSPIDRPA